MRNKLLFVVCCFSILMASSAFALSISIVDPGSVGDLVVLENFESYNEGFRDTLETHVGTFEAGGLAGTGDTSNGSGSPEFSVQDNAGSWYGRYNTTVGGSQWLDSGDITQLTLHVDSAISDIYKSLYFYMMDPSDCGATTIVNGEAFNQVLNFSGEANAALFLVCIQWDDFETLQSIVFNVTTQGDGYGLDDFSTTAPVPEPATMFLLGSGLLGLVGLRKKRK